MAGKNDDIDSMVKESIMDAIKSGRTDMVFRDVIRLVKKHPKFRKILAGLSVFQKTEAIRQSLARLSVSMLNRTTIGKTNGTRTKK